MKIDPMGKNSSSIKRWGIVLTVVFVGGVSASWRQLHNGWVWYEILNNNDSDIRVNVVNQRLLPGVIQRIIHKTNQQKVPKQREEQILNNSEIAQYGIATTDGEIQQLIIQTTFSYSPVLQEQLQQEKFHVQRLGSLLFAQKQTIKLSQLVKKIARNLGKNYLSKKPLALLEFSSSPPHTSQPFVGVIQPYQAGIKAYIARNRDNIRQKEQKKAASLTPFTAADSLDGDTLTSQPGYLAALPASLQKDIENQLQKQLQLQHTESPLSEIIFDHAAAVVRQQSEVAVAIAAEPPATNAIATTIINYLNHEEAYGHLVTQSFLLPDGQLGEEVVPDQRQEYFSTPSDACKTLNGKEVNLVICQDNHQVSIGTTARQVERARHLLDSSSVDWQVTLSSDSLEQWPSLQQWNRLSAYQHQDNIAFFLEK